MAPTETTFEDRLRLYWPELKQLYMELYHDDAMLKKLCRHLAAFSEERRDSLKQRDAEKQESPNWYQSRELLGMMLYIDNFAGNLKGDGKSCKHCGDHRCRGHLYGRNAASDSENGLETLLPAGAGNNASVCQCGGSCRHHTGGCTAGDALCPRNPDHSFDTCLNLDKDVRTMQIQKLVPGQTEVSSNRTDVIKRNSEKTRNGLSPICIQSPNFLRGRRKPVSTDSPDIPKDPLRLFLKMVFGIFEHILSQCDDYSSSPNSQTLLIP